MPLAVEIIELDTKISPLHNYEYSENVKKFKSDRVVMHSHETKNDYSVIKYILIDTEKFTIFRKLKINSM